MPNYAIMRCAKLSGMASVCAALQHCYRERETPNADPAQTPKNVHLAAPDVNTAVAMLHGKLPEKRRKDAVLAVEYVMTASPKWWKQASPEAQQAFFARSHRWLVEKYGADRIITATIHLDETTPHLSAFVVPLTRDGRLSAKEMVGDKRQLSADQTSYAEAVASLGLVRGIEGSRAKHQSIRRYYGALDRQIRETDTYITPDMMQPRVLPPKGILNRIQQSTPLAKRETQTDVAIRLTMRMQDAYAPAVAQAANYTHAVERTAEMRRTLEHQQAQLEPLLNELHKLHRQNRDAVLSTAVDVAREARIEQQRRIDEEFRERALRREQRRGRSR